MQGAELTSQEEKVVGAIATIESSGEAATLERIAAHAALLAAEMTRAVLARLLGELGLVQEVDSDDLGPYFVLSGRAGAETGEAAAGALAADDFAGQIERYVGDHPFPATTEQLVAYAVDRGAPQPLVHSMNGLAADRSHLTLQDLIDAVREDLSN